MTQPDVRWIQRFQNFRSALALLKEAVEKHNNEGLSELEQQGLIQRFEFTHELAWKVMKDYFQFQSAAVIMGSRDAVREAFQYGLIKNGDEWMQMIKSRNQSSHTYIKTTAEELVKNITQVYCKLFLAFQDKMEELKDE